MMGVERGISEALSLSPFLHLTCPTCSLGTLKQFGAVLNSPTPINRSSGAA